MLKSIFTDFQQTYINDVLRTEMNAPIGVGAQSTLGETFLPEKICRPQ